jgi:hypothetical protein
MEITDTLELGEAHIKEINETLDAINAKNKELECWQDIKRGIESSPDSQSEKWFLDAIIHNLGEGVLFRILKEVSEAKINRLEVDVLNMTFDLKKKLKK